MNNDKLREAIEAATEKIFDGYEHQGAGLRCYGKAPSGEFGWFYRTKPQVTDIILAELTPDPVDDKTLTEAIQDLKATQQEAAKLRKALEQIYYESSHWNCIVIARQALADKARAAGEGEGAT